MEFPVCWSGLCAIEGHRVISFVNVMCYPLKIKSSVQFGSFCKSITAIRYTSYLTSREIHLPLAKTTLELDFFFILISGILGKKIRNKRIGISLWVSDTYLPFQKRLNFLCL